MAVEQTVVNQLDNWFETENVFYKKSIARPSNDLYVSVSPALGLTAS
jgi:hypothetical protein